MTAALRRAFRCRCQGDRGAEGGGDGVAGPRSPSSAGSTSRRSTGHGRARPRGRPHQRPPQRARPEPRPQIRPVALRSLPPARSFRHRPRGEGTARAALAEALATWERAQSLAGSAAHLWLEPESTVFELAGMLASLAPDKSEPIARNGKPNGSAVAPTYVVRRGYSGSEPPAKAAAMAEPF